MVQPAAVPPIPARGEIGGRPDSGFVGRAGSGDAAGTHRPIHQDEPDHGPHAVGLGRSKQHLGGVRVGRRKGDDGRRARGRERAHRKRTETFGRGGVESALEWERVSLEPGQQVQPRAEPRVRQLWDVRMEVDQTRHDQPRPNVVDGDVRRGVRALRRCVRHGLAFLGARSDAGDPTSRIDVDRAVGEVSCSAGRKRGQDPRAQPERRGERQRRHRDIYPRHASGSRLLSRETISPEAAPGPESSERCEEPARALRHVPAPFRVPIGVGMNAPDRRRH